MVNIATIANQNDLSSLGSLTAGRMCSRPISIARLNRATRWPGAGCVPFR